MGGRRCVPDAADRKLPQVYNEKDSNFIGK